MTGNSLKESHRKRGSQIFLRSFSFKEAIGHGEARFSWLFFSFPASGTGKFQDPPSLFCGDTLFVAGCGRFMEGSAATMHQSLQALVQLPKKTRVFCGHEYTAGVLGGEVGGRGVCC